MIVLPKEQIERCSKCKKYLSVGPIQLLENKPICGRCPDVLGFSAQLYENLVKYMFFPCVNDLHGCDATLAWGSVETHENKCLFSTIECPAITCGETIRPNQLKYHFQLKHENLFLHNSQFEIPLRHIYLDEYINKLTFWRSKPLIVKISVSSRRCFCSILNWSPDGSDELKYSLTVEDIGDLQFGVQSLHIKDIPLPTYKNKYHDITTMTQIDLETMKRILHTDYVTCSFALEGQQRR
ncbi:hypothetical protein JTB14_001901 [Gonioctena quinquepunctata]|nr:hypothetical protein JTB14_001901 [Gonioctena quinquepunctata]